jgi:hypothetical protein
VEGHEHEEEDHSFGKIVIHQAIETIEFVLVFCLYLKRKTTKLQIEQDCMLCDKYHQVAAKSNYS